MWRARIGLEFLESPLAEYEPMKNAFWGKWCSTCNSIWRFRIWRPFTLKLYGWTKNLWKSTSKRRASAEIISCWELESWATIPCSETKDLPNTKIFVCLSNQSDISIPESAPDSRFSLRKCMRLHNQPLRIGIWAQFHSKAHWLVNKQSEIEHDAKRLLFVCLRRG